MKHYFLDTNVVIDYLAQRQPFRSDAAELMQAGVTGEVRLYVSSISFTNIEYILRRATSAQQAWQVLWNLEKLVEIASVDGMIIRKAIIAQFSDFEDGVQYFSAQNIPVISAIVTRDPRGFSVSTISCFITSASPYRIG